MSDGFHQSGMTHLQVGSIWLERIEDPPAEQRCFHRTLPYFCSLLRPTLQYFAPGD